MVIEKCQASLFHVEFTTTFPPPTPPVVGCCQLLLLPLLPVWTEALLRESSSSRGILNEYCVDFCHAFFFSLQLFPTMFVNILKVQWKLSCTFETFKLFLNGGCYSEQYVQYRKILRQCCLLGLKAVLKKYTCTLEKKRYWGKIGGRRAERKEKSWAVPWNLGFLEKSRSKIKLTFTLLVKKQ